MSTPAPGNPWALASPSSPAPACPACGAVSTGSLVRADGSFGLDQLDDHALAALAEDLVSEQRARAARSTDPKALAKAVFDEAFDGRGRARKPWLVNGLLICPGSVVAKSGTSHECTFVAVGDRWVWESPDALHDLVRQLPGPRDHQQSVSVVLAREGLELDVVSSKMSMGTHEMQRADSYVITEGALVQVSTRARSAQGHGSTRRG